MAKSLSRLEDRIKNWAEEANGDDSLSLHLRGAWAWLIRRVFSFKFRFWSVTFSGLRVLVLFASILIPIVLARVSLQQVAKDVDVKSTTDLLISSWPYLAALIVLHLYAYVYDRVRARGSSDKQQRELQQQLINTRVATTKRVTELIRRGEIKDDAEAGQSILKCIQYEVQLFLREYDQTHFSVAAIAFDAKNAWVQYRADMTRATGITQKKEKTLAYWVATNSVTAVINDFQKELSWIKRGLSEVEPPPYRSVLFLPMLEHKSGEYATCPVVVCLNSTKNYEFWPNQKKETLYLLARPYLYWLAAIMGDGDSGISVPVPLGD